MMPRDNMTKEQRLQAVFDLRVPDRVPVVPLFSFFLGRFAKISSHELLFDRGKFLSAWKKLIAELGDVDAVYYDCVGSPTVVQWYLPMKMRWPGIDVSANEILQMVEEEVMKAEDYALLTKPSRVPKPLLYSYWLLQMLARVRPDLPAHPGLRAAKVLWEAALLARSTYPVMSYFRGQQTPYFLGGASEGPFDIISLERSMQAFALDLFRRPQEVRDASLACVEGVVGLATVVAAFMKEKRICLALHRSGSSFISPRQFKELSLPALKAIVQKLVDKGFNVVLHCDGRWDPTFELLLELPPGKCMIQLDGQSDIFRAKEVFAGHHSIYGDVPALLLASGSTTEVDEYCKKLIRVVGKNGGFCLGSGCNVAPDAKPENVKVMLESVRKYGYYA